MVRVGEGHDNRTHREVAQKFPKPLRCWNHGYCLLGTPVRQASCGFFLVLSSSCPPPFGVKIGSPTSDLGKPASLSYWVGFHTHQPLQQTAPLCSQPFLFLFF